MNRTTDMTVDSPVKHLIRFAFPLIVTNIGQQIYMIVDASIVGRGVGMKAFAAVGATDWIYFLILWTIVGLTQGISTFVSRYFGDKDYTQMNRAIAMCSLLCGAIGILLTVVGLLTAYPLLLLLNTPEDIIDSAHIYLITLTSGTLIVTAYNMAASVLRALGDGSSPLIAMIIAALLNIGLDLLFVFVLELNIFGAALASVLSQLVSFIYCYIKIRKVDCIKLGREAWQMDWELMKEIFLFGIPLAMQHILIALGGIILQSAVNQQGSIFIAGYTAPNKVYGLLESSAISLGLATATFLSQNYGAKNYERVKKGFWTALGLVILMSLIISALAIVFRDPFMRLFLDVSEDGAAEAHGIAMNYLMILAVCLVILYLLHIFRNSLYAMQISLWSMISGFAEFAARVFMSITVIRYMGSDALFFAEPVAWFAALVVEMVPFAYFYRKLLCSPHEIGQIDS